MPAGKKVSSVVAVEEIWNPRRVQQSSTRTTVTSRQSLDMWLRRTAVVEPSTDILNDKECSAELKRCCKKLVKKSTEVIHRHLHDGTTPRVQIFVVTHWVDTEQDLRQSCFTLKFDTLDPHNESRRSSATITSTAWLLLKRRENARDCTAKTQHHYGTIPRNQQIRQRKRQAFEGIEEYDYEVDARTGWRFTTESRGDLPTASSSSILWDRNYKHSSWSDDSWTLSERKTSRSMVLNMELPKATNVPLLNGDVAESSPTQAWRISIHTWRWHKSDDYRKDLSKIGWTGRAHHPTRRTCTGRPLLYWNTKGKSSQRETSGYSR